jgi:single-strand DNA-binding protein
MNRCTFSGRLTADAESRYTNSGTVVSNFSIAVDTGYGDYKRTEFIRCVMFKRENLVQYLTKGKPVIVSGEYQERKWQDREGQERRSVEILVREVEFQLAAPRGEGGQVNGAVKSAPAEPETPDNATDGLDEAPFAMALVPLAGMLASALNYLPGMM